MEQLCSTSLPAMGKKANRKKKLLGAELASASLEGPGTSAATWTTDSCRPATALCVNIWSKGLDGSQSGAAWKSSWLGFGGSQAQGWCSGRPICERATADSSEPLLEHEVAGRLLPGVGQESLLRQVRQWCRP